MHTRMDTWLGGGTKIKHRSLWVGIAYVVRYVSQVLRLMLLCRESQLTDERIRVSDECKIRMTGSMLKNSKGDGDNVNFDEPLEYGSFAVTEVPDYGSLDVTEMGTPVSDNREYNLVKRSRDTLAGMLLSPEPTAFDPIDEELMFDEPSEPLGEI
eukprot:CAMPEP_0167750546 /NCGR_PEP_ID=MMETSP0110_2-20121227/6057_1 /TAXON_ID=629695 /ORGANISM="Gymnochlora sp., Strain CCMP2014" /LENGTH=154 /DNA_ID=CAMNT_0007635891 /DNA_START=268 /DNA_END=732 /DNA_ORIENTATION=-